MMWPNLMDLFPCMKKKPKSEPMHLVIARAELGVAEIVGNQHNPRILEYHKTTTLGASSDEVSWCASFANWCLEKSYKTGTKSALARSFLGWGMIVKDEDVELGDIVVLKRGKEPWQGHVGFFISRDETFVYILGGNQSNKVSIAKYDLKDVLGYRRPV